MYISKLTIIGSDNGLSPGQHQAIVWTNAETLLNRTRRNKLLWNFDQNSYIFRVSSGQGKVREIPDLAKVREKSGNFVEGQGKNEYWEKSGKSQGICF